MNEELFYEQVTSVATYLSKGKQWLDEIKSSAKNSKDDEQRAIYGAIVRNCTQHYAKVVALEKTHLLCELTTGFGKTKIAIDLAVHLKNTIGSPKILVIHQLVNHKANLLKDFIKFYGKKTVDSLNITWSTYRSAKKYADQEFDLVIMDEAHHITPNNHPYLMSITSGIWLHLSATVPPEKRRLLSSLAGDTPMSVLKVPMKKAEDWGVLPRIEYLLLPVYADHKERNQTYHYRKTKNQDNTQYMSFNKFNATQYKSSNIIVTCTEQEYIRLLDEEMKYWFVLQDSLKKKGDDVMWIWNTQIKPLGARRKAYYAEIKGNYLVKALQPLIEELRTVIFAERIEQLENFNIKVIHSNQSNDENAKIIEDFNNSVIHEIGAVNMLNESQNLSHIQLGIILQLATRSKVINIQRQGRSVRGKQPFVLLPYVFGSKDEENCKAYMKDYSTQHFTSPEELITYVRKAIDDKSRNTTNH